MSVRSEARSRRTLRGARPVRADVVLERQRFDVLGDRGLRLATLHHQIQEGTYVIRPRAIAEAMVGEGLFA